MLRNPTNDMVIGNHTVGPDARTFIIAEIGNNHNGCFDRAKEMVDLAKKAAVDCMEISSDLSRSIEKTLKKTGEDLATEYLLICWRKLN